MADPLAVRILRFLDNRAEEQIRFLTDLCDQNSHTHYKEGTDRVAEMVLNRLDGFFPDHRVVRNTDLGDHHVLSTAGDKNAVYLVGHTDTVFPQEHAFQKCVRKDDVLLGPGTGDMKGGLAVIVYALLALKHTGMDRAVPLTLVLNSDEEIGSPSSQSLFENERNRASACFVAECAGLNGEFVVSRNGKMCIRITSVGKDRHVGSGTEKKASAILEMAQKIVEIEQLNATLPGVSVNVGKVEGGLGPSTVPGTARCLVDVRWIDGTHQALLEARIEKILNSSGQEGCISRFEIMNQRPAMPESPGSAILFDRVEKTAERLGMAVGKAHRRGTSDANFFGSAGVPTLDGWGPVCEHDHTPEEYIRIHSLKARSALLAIVLAEYDQPGR